jgi:hypothetical protein
LPAVVVIKQWPSFCRIVALSVGCYLLNCTDAFGQTVSVPDSILEKLSALEKQNAQLVALLKDQQKQIEELSLRISETEELGNDSADLIEELQEDSSSGFEAIASSSSNIGSKVHISGEAGIVFFAGEANTQFPNEEFRVDEARLFVEAEVARDIYFFSSIFLFNRDMDNSNLFVGELYVDWENPFGLENLDRLINFRAGQFPIPFGQEYEYRYVMENPLVSRALQDIMGMDEGISFYGEVGDFDYVLAIQNGGANSLRDFSTDNSITFRGTYNVNDQLSLVGSFHTTGNIDSNRDRMSAIWFGGGLFQSIGSVSAEHFKTELLQLDANFSWEKGWIRGTVGQADYRDTDGFFDNSRDMDYFSLEAVHFLSPRLHAAFRIGQIDTNGGYPIPGNGNREAYFMSGLQTENLDRVSLGLGYWPAENVVTKIEYTIEEGKLSDGTDRNQGDQVAAQIAVRY